jgi:DNA-binding XRE family transcriptional regulator
MLKLATDEMTAAERLREARIAAGYKSAAAFAQTAGIKIATYQHHENGTREFQWEAARDYERMLDLKPGTLLYGAEVTAYAQIPIVSRIGQGGKVAAILTAPDTVALNISPEDAGDLVATAVTDDSLRPAYRAGDIVFHRSVRPDRFRLRDLHGLECVAEIADGTVLLRVLSVQPNGLCTLVGYDGGLLADQSVIAASPIEYVRKHLPAVLADR